MDIFVIVIILVIGILTAGIVYAIYTEEKPVINSENDQSAHYTCSGTAVCYVGKVTEVIDGDTLRIRGSPIRLALASAPELNEENGIKARDFVAKLCPLGSNALVDEDDKQTSGSYGRMVAKVVCGTNVVNSRLVEEGFGEIDKKFCSKSEFASEDWAKKYGC
ncbi:MAG: thermonuclease family protein [Nitrosopumilaceae archaeon]